MAVMTREPHQPHENPDPEPGPKGLGKTAVRALLTLAALACLCQAVQMTTVLLTGLRQPPGIDDAYAFCRYADHFLADQGLAWNPGGPSTYGCTSLLYVFWIIALKIVLLWPCAPTLAIGSWLPALLTILVLGFACAQHAQTRPLNHWLVGLGFVCLCTGLPASFFYHAQHGMDTTLGMLVNALLVLTVAQRGFSGSMKRVGIAAGFAYLAFLARPENLVYASLFPFLVLVLARGARRRRWGPVLAFCGILAALLAFDTAIKTCVFGNPLPLPFYAKTGGYYQGYVGDFMWNPVFQMRSYLLAVSLPLAIVLCLADRRNWRFLLAALLPCAMVFAYLATVRQIMGYQARFYFPSLPFIVVAAYAALDAGVSRIRSAGFTFPPRAAAIRAVTLMAAVLVLGPFGARASAWYEEYARAKPSLYQSGLYAPEGRVERIGWQRSNTAILHLVLRCPREVVWAMTEHGQVGAHAPGVRIIDLAGLHDRATLTDTPIVEHMLAQKPDVIWFPHHHYTGMVHALRTSQVLAEDYDYWPDAFDHGLAVLKSGGHRSEVTSVLKDVWFETYAAPLPPPSTRCRRGARSQRAAPQHETGIAPD